MDTGFGNRLQEKLPFALGARDLRFEYDNIRDILQRMRTGAAISATEEEFYKDQIPGLLDNEETRKRKIQNLEGLFTRIKNAVDPNGNMTSSMMSGDIEVMDIETGKAGTIPAEEFDASKYIRI